MTVRFVTCHMCPNEPFSSHKIFSPLLIQGDTSRCAKPPVDFKTQSSALAWQGPSLFTPVSSLDLSIKAHSRIIFQVGLQSANRKGKEKERRRLHSEFKNLRWQNLITGEGGCWGKTWGEGARRTSYYISVHMSRLGETTSDKVRSSPSLPKGLVIINENHISSHKWIRSTYKHKLHQNFEA